MSGLVTRSPHRWSQHGIDDGQQKPAGIKTLRISTDSQNRIALPTMHDSNVVPPRSGPDNGVGETTPSVSGTSSVVLPTPPTPGEHLGRAGADPTALRSDVLALLERIEEQPGAATELFESAHEVLLRALATVDRA